MKTKSSFLCVLALALSIFSCDKKEEKVALQSISIAPASLTLTVDETGTLTATPLPENADDVSLKWSSNDETIATVSDAGVVTAKKAGSTFVSVRSGNVKSADVAVTVNAKQVDLTGITLSPDPVTIAIGATQQLTATPVPADATNPVFTYASADESIASVSSTGLITANALGTTSITVSSGTVSRDVTVTVETGVTDITVPASLSIAMGDAPIPVVVTFVPEGKTAELEYSFNPTGKASVNGAGELVAEAAGATTLTVSVANTNISKTVSVTVTKKSRYPLSFFRTQDMINNLTATQEDGYERLVVTGNDPHVYSVSNLGAALECTTFEIRFQYKVSETINDCQFYLEGHWTPSYTLTQSNDWQQFSETLNQSNYANFGNAGNMPRMDPTGDNKVGFEILLKDIEIYVDRSLPGNQ
ncbi:MAG: Ig-like domain-containing protein [Bacteroidales bacterium]|jgi:hypothetical protein|nr:Ig-like domain-containing protein [Bacteroidales bacterium]